MLSRPSRRTQESGRSAGIRNGAPVPGEEMTVADIYVAMFFIWHRGDIEAPRLARIAEAVRDHPVVEPVWRRHFGARQGKD